MNHWSPDQYERFRAERLQPARDLIALVERPRASDPSPMRVIDLGCGTGEPTALLTEHLGPSARIEGVDTSEEMLSRAAARASEQITFRRADAGAIASFADYDLVFSNATLHWVPDHEALFGGLLRTLPPGGQLAIQMPVNGHHPSHTTAAAVAGSEPFASWLEGFLHTSATLPLERYAELLFEYGHGHGQGQGQGQGFERTRLFEQVYSHRLERSSDVVEWVKGTTLVPYLTRLGPERGAAFLDEYRRRLLDVIGDRAPYLFTFRRMFLWARRAGARDG